MDINKDLDELEAAILKQSDEISGQEKANAIANLATQPENMVRIAVSEKISNKVQNDDITKDRIDKTADKLVESGVTTIENEAEESKNKSEQGVLQSYFDKHKEELKTAGIDKPTYIEDMERAVKWHKRWSNFHWRLVGWWMCGIRTFIQKAKPFKAALNIIAVILFLGTTVLGVWGIVELIKWIW